MTFIVIQNNGSVFFCFFVDTLDVCLQKTEKVKKSSSMKELKIVLRLEVLNEGQKRGLNE